jgi:hypothetical protein
VRGRVGASLSRRLPPRVVRSIVGFGLACIASADCGGDVSVQLLPGDNQALTQKDAAPDVADACVDPCPGFVRALYFKGPYERVEIANSPLLDVPQDFAIEAWVLVKSYAGGHGVLNRWVAGVGDIELTFGIPDQVSFAELPSTAPLPSHVLATWGFVRPDLWISTVAPTLPSAGAWHHLASSYGGGSLRLYVDGKRVSGMDSTERIANAPNSFFIGATSRSEHAFDPNLGTSWWPPIDGYIAEVRISAKNRYTMDFVPDRRLLPEASTIALWHLDEGKGDIALDSGPNHLNGVITGPQWVAAPAR